MQADNVHHANDTQTNSDLGLAVQIVVSVGAAVWLVFTSCVITCLACTVWACVLTIVSRAFGAIKHAGRIWSSDWSIGDLLLYPVQHMLFAMFNGAGSSAIGHICLFIKLTETAWNSDCWTCSCKPTELGSGTGKGDKVLYICSVAALGGAFGLVGWLIVLGLASLTHA